MKKLLLFIIFIGLGQNAYSRSYTCTRSASDPTIIISTEVGAAFIEYVAEGKSTFKFSLPDTSVIKGNYWETKREYINFNPGWGESTVNIYGRISTDESSIFDIFVRGMRGNLVQSLVSYKCLKQ